MLADVPHPVAQVWRIHQVSHAGGVTVDRGTVRGTPFGHGTIRCRTAAERGQVVLRFSQQLRRGTVRGKVWLGFTSLGGGKVHYVGHGRYTSGTRAYRGISGLLRTFRGSSSGSRARLRVSGTVSYQ